MPSTVARRRRGLIAGLVLISVGALLALMSAATMTFKATAAPGDTSILAAAGDIVCSPGYSNYDGGNPGKCQHRLTDDLLAGANAVAPLGDLQYPDGRLEYFNEAYHPTWGQHAAKTYPVPGNHEYNIRAPEDTSTTGTPKADRPAAVGITGTTSARGT